MGLLKHFSRNRGAGILFARQKGDKWEVLLCRRRKSGQWSVPAGLRGKESYRECALREAGEEVRCPEGPSGNEPFVCIFRLRLPPLYSWDTYLWIIHEGERFPAGWPDWHCAEFSEVAWFPLETPPKPLYFLMPLTLAGARQYLKKLMVVDRQ